MKIITLVVFLLLLGIGIKANGQSAAHQDSARFVDALTRYIKSRARYPIDEKDKEVGGQVILSFRVNADQTISNIKIIKDWNAGPGGVVATALKNFKSVYAIKPGEYTFSVLYTMLDEADARSKETDDVIIKKPGLIFKNYLGEAEILGYGYTMHFTHSGGEGGFVMPDFNAHKGRVKALITREYDTDTDKGEVRKGKLVEKTSVHFDSKGNTLDYTTLNAGGAILRKQLYKYSNSKLRYAVSIFNQDKIPYEKTKEIYNKQGEYIEIDRYSGYNNGRDSLTSKSIAQYNDKGLRVLALNYDMRTNKLSTKDSAEYNDKGLVTTAFFLEDIHGIIVNLRHVFKYNNAGLKLMEAYYQGSSDSLSGVKNDTLHSRKFFVYDNKRMITEATYNSNGIITDRKNYVRTDKGKQEEWINYRADGKINQRFVYEYDTMNNQTSQTLYYPKGYVFKDTYIYDNNHHVLEHESYRNGALVDKKTFKYDTEGNQIEEINDITHTTTDKKPTFTYANRDAQGNWLKAIWTDEQSLKRYIVEREITYYH